MLEQPDAQVVVCLVPKDDGQPVELIDDLAALRMVMVDRSVLKRLDASWDRPGVYILLYKDLAPDIRYGCYVGKAPTGLRKRVLQHLQRKDEWCQALLIRRDTGFGYNSAQVGWLEGGLYEHFKTDPSIRSFNMVRPSDDTLAPHDIFMLKTSILSILGVCRLIGFPVNKTVPMVINDPKPPTHYKISLMDLITAGLLEGDEELISTNGQWPATAQIYGDGRIGYDGQKYNSPSGAGRAAKSGGATDGWTFWRVVNPGGQSLSLATIRDAYLAEQAATSVDTLDDIKGS